MLHISNDNYFEWRFGNIYYTKKGTGSPILLIHDTLPGASGYEWSKIEDELAIDHTVYTVDLLGCGRSDKSSITYTNFVYVQMISDFIKKNNWSENRCDCKWFFRLFCYYGLSQ